MNHLALFRIKITDDSQSGLFDHGLSRPAFLRTLIESRPSGELKRNYVWHIGNVTDIGNNGIIFAAGRTTKTNKELYDEASGNFIEVEDEESPFTQVVCDLQIGLLAIQQKSRLAPTANGIARSISQLLNLHEDARNRGATIEISELWDPQDFLEQLSSAHSVLGFSVDFGEPNPFDVETEFHRPMEKYLSALGGVRGRTVVKGKDLDRGRIEDVTRSVASTGNNASARIRKRKNTRPVTRHLKGDPVYLSVPEAILAEGKGILEMVREAYRRIRNRNE